MYINFFCFLPAATEDDDEIVQRGCVDTNTPAECSEAASETCKTCEGRNCNEKIEFQTCHVCDDCELIPTGAQTLCEEYMAQCNVYIDSGNYLNYKNFIKNSFSYVKILQLVIKL